MTLPTVDLDLMLIAGRAVFLLFSFILAAVMFSRWCRATREQTGQLLANHAELLQRMSELESRLDATNVTISGLAARLERPQQLTSVGTAASPGYQYAIRLARSGASREEIMAGCALSSQEAELVHRLHAPQSRPQRSNAA